jgi:ParB family chromosome partitioning protein
MRTDPVAERVARAGRKLRPPGLPELENLLSDHLDTRVSVVMSEVDRRGKVVIEFADLEDLERIYRRMTDDAKAPTSE